MWGLKPFPVLAIVGVARKRLHSNPGLALVAWLALTISVALSVSIPTYAEGASLRLLKQELARKEEQSGRSVFTLLFRYVGTWNTPLDWSRIAPADAYLKGTAIGQLGLPLDGLGRYARTEPLPWFWPATGGGRGKPLSKTMSLGFVSGLEAQMRLVDGNMPEPATDLDRPVEAIIMRQLADTIGVNVGDIFHLVKTTGGEVVSFPVIIAGLWEPLNANDPAWFFQPEAFSEVFLVPEATFTGPIADAMKKEVGQMLWFIRLNGQHLSVSEAVPLLARIEQVRLRAAGMVQGLRLEQSPVDALMAYRKGAEALTQQLVVLSVPIFGLVFSFVSLVASMLINRQGGEIALLKTRGVRDAHILAIAVVEWCGLGSMALVTGPGIGFVFASVIGQTTSFLSFSPDSAPPDLRLTGQSIGFGVGAVVLAILAALFPSFAATRRTLVDEQQQAARVQQSPLWQRFYLDFLLMIPSVYGMYQLQPRGGAGGGGEANPFADPLKDPLPSLIPVLFCFAGGLFAVRIIPVGLELLAHLARLPSWITPLVALRALARQPVSYRGALLLLVLTLGLATFSASMAATLDSALETSIRYRVGAMTQLIEANPSTERKPSPPPSGQPQLPTRKAREEEARFLFIPVSEHLLVPGITAVARVGEYPAFLQLGGMTQNAQLFGIDRLDFPKVVTYFDPRWSGGESLGGLMNLLARTAEGVIVSRSVVEQGVRVGDPLPVTLELYGDRRQLRFIVVAVVDLWPGAYPQDGPILVANLDYVFDQMGGRYPYHVWITRDPQVPLSALVQGVRARGFTVMEVRDAATMIRDEQLHPRRQGVLGLLSVGFLAAAVLTLVGFLLSALTNARKRAIEMGVLRALGMSGKQVATALLIEQVLLIATGLGVGTGIGLLAAHLIIPLYQVGVGPHPGTPASPPQVAWGGVMMIYIVFGLALAITVGVLMGILSRMRLFQAVKLGDAH